MPCIKTENLSKCYWLNDRFFATLAKGGKFDAADKWQNIIKDDFLGYGKKYITLILFKLVVETFFDLWLDVSLPEGPILI